MRFTVEVDAIDVSLIFSGEVVFVGSDPFSGTGAEIRYERRDGIVQGDVNGDGVVDFEIKLVGRPDLLPESFIL